MPNDLDSNSQCSHPLKYTSEQPPAPSWWNLMQEFTLITEKVVQTETAQIDTYLTLSSDRRCRGDTEWLLLVVLIVLRSTPPCLSSNWSGDVFSLSWIMRPCDSLPNSRVCSVRLLQLAAPCRGSSLASRIHSCGARIYNATKYHTYTIKFGL